MTTFIPHYKREGNEVIHKYESDFHDRNGNKAILTNIIYKDKKGKHHQEVIAVKWISIKEIKPSTVKIKSHIINYKNHKNWEEVESIFVLKNISFVKVFKNTDYNKYHMVFKKSELFKKLFNEGLVIECKDLVAEDVYCHTLFIKDIAGNSTNLYFFTIKDLETALKQFS